MAATIQRQTSVLRKETRRKPAISERGLTMSGELAAVGPKSCNTKSGLDKIQRLARKRC
jgi:hypothetical protein